MGFQMGQLSVYTSQISDILLKSVLPETLHDSVEIMEKIKYKTAINLLTNDLVYTTTACGPTATGNTTPYQRVLEVCPITSFQKLCMTDLNQYWINENLSPGSNITDLDWFGKYYIPDVQGLISEDVQKLAWQGDTDSGSNILSLCDGWKYVLSAATNRVSTGSTTMATPASVVTQINLMILAIPEAVQGKPVNIYLSHSLYNMFIQGWTASYPYQQLFVNGTYSHPMYANIVFKPQTGLNGVNWIFIGEQKNFVFGTDIKDENSKMEIVYNPFDKYIYTTINWKQGVQVKWPDQIVTNF